MNKDEEIIDLDKKENDEKIIDLDETTSNEELIDLDGTISDEELIDLDEMDHDKEIDGTGDMHSSKNGKPRFRINLHMILIAAIIIIAATSVYRLNKWNQGTKQEEDDEDIDTSQFDIEVLDMILPMDSAKLAGHEDDGVTTILCLGNNPFSDDRESTGLASQIAAKTDAVVYDCAFPDSSAACKYPVYNPEYTKDHFNFFYVVECFRNNEFTAINSIANDEPDPRFAETVEVMKTVDMDKVDVLLIMYDSTDYNIGTPSDNPDNPMDVTAFTGGLRTTLENIKTTWPYIRIFLLSPTYAQAIDEEGNISNGTITDMGNGTLNHYMIKEADVAMDCGISFIDNYYGTINEDNYTEYMSDHMHYNDKGREKLADRIADIINNRMAVVNSAQ